MDILKAVTRDFFKWRYPVVDDNTPYIHSGIKWICAAQDSGSDDGVARDYHLIKGWRSSYPETTGYIIPTMFQYYHTYGDEDIRDRALRMADWLVSIQLPCGGIQAGTIDDGIDTPTVFNTGQVIMGWARAFDETKNKSYLEALKKAADWLVDIQSPDGSWCTGKSPCAAFTGNVYYVRVAWALGEAWRLTLSEDYRSACIKNISWTIKHQNVCGWFSNNCLSDREYPLLHTIGYAMRGLLEAGLLLDNSAFITAAKKTADNLMRNQLSDGSLYGRYDCKWSPNVTYKCLTGIAQTSIVWLKLYQFLQNKDYLKAVKKANRYLKSTINLDSSNQGIYGGVKGSIPVWAVYGKYQYLNWAVKFVVDALMLEKTINNQTI